MRNETWSNDPSENSWATDRKHKVCKACDYKDDNKEMVIKIEKGIIDVIDHLCDKIVDEWQMLLSGKVEEWGILVDGYYIPNQEVTSGSVTNTDCVTKEFIDENSIVATIHSHSNMGVFFSATDEDSTILPSQLIYHIVVNNKGEYKACQKTLLPCGMTMLKEVEVVSLEEKPNVEVRGVDRIVKKLVPLVVPLCSYGNEWWRKRNDDGNCDLIEKINNNHKETKKERKARLKRERELEMVEDILLPEEGKHALTPTQHNACNVYD